MSQNRVHQPISSTFTGIDILKFILAVLVVNVHVHGIDDLLKKMVGINLHPLNSIPVSTFFLISSFFLFRKIHVATRPLGVFLHFMKRVVVLYVVWIVVWTPYYILHRTYYFNTGLAGVGQLVNDFLFTDVFANSWFFGALIVGMALVYFLSRIMSDKVWWMIPTALFVYCRLSSILPDDYHALLSWYMDHTGASPTLSFPYATFWIMLGYHFAKPGWEKRLRSIHSPWRWAAMAVAVMGCWVADAYTVVSHPLAAVLIFVAFLNWNPGIGKNRSLWLRHSSIILYTTHGSIEKILRVFLGFHAGMLSYAITLFVSILIAYVLISLSQKRGFRWLRYAY